MYDTHANEYNDVAYPDDENLCCVFSLFGIKNDNFPKNQINKLFN